MARKRRFKIRREPGEEEAELNLASIIDCFMIVITYLLFTAAFISLAEMDVSAVTIGGAAQSTAPVETIAVAMEQQKVISIQAHGTENVNFSLPMKDGEWDLSGLQEKLGELKQKFPSVDSLVLGAEDGIEYQEIVKVLQSSQKVYPKVGLADLKEAT